MLWRSRKSRLLELFRDAIAEHLAFLTALGYGEPTVTAEREHTPMRSLTFGATFRSPLREVYVGVSTLEGRRPPGVIRPNIVVAFVYRRPHRDMDDILELTLFMERYRPDLAQELERLEDEAQTPESLGAFINAAVPIVSSVLANDARGIIAGERWETGFWRSWT